MAFFSDDVGWWICLIMVPVLTGVGFTSAKMFYFMKVLVIAMGGGGRCKESFLTFEEPGLLSFFLILFSFRTLKFCLNYICAYLPIAIYAISPLPKKEENSHFMIPSNVIRSNNESK